MKNLLAEIDRLRADLYKVCVNCNRLNDERCDLMKERDALRSEQIETIAQMSKNYQELHHELAKTAEWCAELLRKNRGQK